MTDAQVPNEHFLVLINDMLASGEVPDLFGDDDVENIIAGVRNEASANRFSFFKYVIRINTFKYHVFAPMGFQLESIYLYFPPSSQLGKLILTIYDV